MKVSDLFKLLHQKRDGGWTRADVLIDSIKRTLRGLAEAETLRERGVSDENA